MPELRELKKQITLFEKSQAPLETYQLVMSKYNISHDGVTAHEVGVGGVLSPRLSAAPIEAPSPLDDAKAALQRRKVEYKRVTQHAWVLERCSCVHGARA
jgi:hypothetical protein